MEAVTSKIQRICGLDDFTYVSLTSHTCLGGVNRNNLSTYLNSLARIIGSRALSYLFHSSSLSLCVHPSHHNSSSHLLHTAHSISYILQLIQLLHINTSCTMSEATKKTAPTLSQRETEILIAALTNVKSGELLVSEKSPPARKPCTRLEP